MKYTVVRVNQRVLSVSQMVLSVQSVNSGKQGHTQGRGGGGAKFHMNCMVLVPMCK